MILGTPSGLLNVLDSPAPGSLRSRGLLAVNPSGVLNVVDSPAPRRLAQPGAIDIERLRRSWHRGDGIGVMAHDLIPKEMCAFFRQFLHTLW